MNNKKDNPVASLDNKVIVDTIEGVIEELSKENDTVGDFEPIKWLITKDNFMLQTYSGKIIELQNARETYKEQPLKYNLKEILDTEINTIKDKYGYMQEHFTPLVTHLSRDGAQMLFCGFEINLKSNGTYFITDTTGG